MCVESFPLLLLITLAACGGGNAPGPGPATISGTLAYVVNDCRENVQGWSFSQALQIQQGEDAPITAKKLDYTLMPPRGLCPLYGLERYGPSSVSAFAFQRLGMSPDGSTVVFEVTDEFSILHRPEFGGIGGLVPAEEKGIFLVHADGSSLRRLGDASREPPFRVAADPTAPGGLSGWTWGAIFAFSPNGKLITFTDLGPSSIGEEATQVFVIDLVTGTRTQLTDLPPLEPASPFYPTVFPPFFLDNETIQFWTFAVSDVSTYTVTTDTRQLTLREPIPIPGSALVPLFSITGVPTSAFSVILFGRTPVNPLPHLETVVYELFTEAGESLLQLTNFNRSDTGNPLLTPDGQRLLFTASADPFGANPHETCQIFSIDTLGAGLRQLTNFDAGAHSVVGCAYPYPPGCTIQFMGPDRRTDALLFESTCNPLGTNPNGGQFFAMHFDGTGLRQLSAFRGMTTEADGTVTVELPGPFAYSRP